MNPNTGFVAQIFSSMILCFLSWGCSDEGPQTEELSRASGIYMLTELNVAPPQDIDGDGVASVNLLDELNCISGTLYLRADGTYALSLVGIEIVSVPNDRFFFACAPIRNSDSTWNIQNGSITLFADVTTTPYLLNDNELARIVGENLPGIQSVVYVKQ